MPEEAHIEGGPDKDSELLGRLKRHDEDAFDELVLRHRREVYRLALRMTGSAAEADDIAQETFFRAWQAIEGFRGEASLRTWLLRIAANLSLNVVTSARVARREPGGLSGVEPAVAPQAETRLLEQERQERLAPAILALPDRQRLTLLLRVDQGLMFKEIAQMMGCTVGTAKANFFHAVAGLKRALGKVSR